MLIETERLILEGNSASIALAETLGSSLIRAEQGLPGITDQRVMIYGQSSPGLNIDLNES